MEKPVNLILLGEVFHANVDPRRRPEKRNSELPPDGRSSTANLSEKTVYRTFDQNEGLEHFRYSRD